MNDFALLAFSTVFGGSIFGITTLVGGFEYFGADFVKLVIE